MEDREQRINENLKERLRLFNMLMWVALDYSIKIWRKKEKEDAKRLQGRPYI